MTDADDVLPSVLEARDIAKELGQGAGRVRALKGVSLTLNPGELTLSLIHI